MEMIKRCLVLILAFAFQFGISQINFVDRANIVGLTSETGTTPFGGNGVSFADFDNDGFDDITLASAGGVPLRFYKNIDGLVFVEQFLLPDTADYDYRTRSINWVDIDNDGDRDLFVSSDTDGNRLFENQNGILSDITVQAGFPLDNLVTYGASWGDINNDGCLDVYLSNRISGINTSISNYLFQNNCDGTFSEVAETIGLANLPALTFCSAIFDFNNDGWQDIYVANDKFEPNFLFKNNGDGTFTDVSVSSGTDLVIDAMSITVDDFNSDGFFDIYMTNTPIGISTPEEGAVLLKNNGDETFSNISSNSGTDIDSFTWGSSFLDADNDTDLDLYVNSQYDGSNDYSSYAFYENTGNDVFTRPDDVGFMTNWHNSYAVAVGDYNGDGFQELLVNNNGHIPSLWQNIDPTGGNYLLIDLKGNLSNADGIGSVIEISVNGSKHFRHVLCGEGYLSQNSFIEHFGLGSSTEVDYVKVFWLSGVVDLITDVSANQKLTISEGSTLSVSDQQALDVTVYPNPTPSEFVIESKVLVQEIEIYNSTGKQIMTVKPISTTVSIDISPFHTGVYFVRVKANSMIKVVKLIKFNE